MKKLQNRVAIVTGASKGIGAGIAKAFGREGATVVVNFLTDQGGAEQTVREIVAQGGKAVSIRANVSHEDEVATLFEEVKSRFGHLDVLVNNAGVFGATPLESMSIEEFNRIFSVNVLGTLLPTKAAVALFPNKGGSVINISSAASSLAAPMLGLYASSKGAIDVITRTLAKELAPRAIRVNAINPGLIETEGSRAAGVIGTPMEKQILATTPLGRAGTPEEVALPAVFLASDDARYISGETLYVSGAAAI